MTKSELIVSLAGSYPQLLAKVAGSAVSHSVFALHGAAAIRAPAKK